MKKRLIIVLVVGIIIPTTILVIWQCARSTHYHGRSLHDWSQPAVRGEPEAVAAMKAMGQKAVPELIQMLQFQESSLHRWMVKRANGLPPKWRQTALQKLRQPEPATMHETAAKCLGMIGPDASAAAPFLVQALRDRQGTVCWTAAAALGKIGKGSVGPLTRALGDNDNVVRHAAAYALGEVGPDAEPAVPALIHCLVDRNELVRNSAAYSLSTIGAPAVIALFQAQRNSDAPFSNAVTVVLDKMDAADAGTIRPLIAMAKTGELPRRRRALEALTLYCSRSTLAVKAMTELLKDPLPEIRLAAIEFLNQAGPRAHTATPSLKNLAADPEMSVRAAAREVLARFEK